MGGRRVVRVRGAGNDVAELFESFLDDPKGDALLVIEAGDLPRSDGRKGERREVERRKDDRRKITLPRGDKPERRRGERRSGQRRRPPKRTDS